MVLKNMKNYKMKKNEPKLFIIFIDFNTLFEFTM
jgi:hypothetical protein